MSTVLVVAVAIIASAGAAPSVAGLAQESDNPARVVEAFHDALSGGDSEAVLKLLDPAVVIFESGGSELSRDEYASHHLGGDMEFTAATERTLIDQSEHQAGDLAYVMTRSRTTGTFRDREIDSNGVETMVLRRASDGWRIVHIHWSSRAARPQ